MPDVKISALPASTTPLAGTEVLPIVQSATTRQVSVANLTAGRSVGGTNFIPSGSSVPTNGLYLPAANSLGFSTNSSERMRISSIGAVSIGTNSASAEFHVLSAQGNNGYGGSSDTGMVLIESTGTTGGDLNASFISKNYYGFGQIMQWSNLGMRIGNRGTANGGAGEVIFTYGSDAEGMRINSSGNATFANNISVGAATPTTSGTGITFPATQNASSNANTLDDYEEGTWTPTDTSGAGLTFTINSSQYTKIGRAVTINFEIVWPVTVDVNTVAVSLPFTPNASNSSGLSAMSNVAGEVNIYTFAGASFNLYNDTGVAITNATMSTKYLIVSLTYFA